MAPHIHNVAIAAIRLTGGNANLILSPFNIATALSMALAGARGQTAEEIQSVLQLNTANGLWVQKGFAIQLAFENTLTNNYHAPLTLLDFIANPEAARSQINRWTEEQTKEKIRNLLPAGSLDARTRLVLTSAIYFYGKWQDPFVTSRTQLSPFTLPTGAITQANFMHRTSHFGYTETPSAQILEMRYAGTGIVFDILLPKTLTGLPDLETASIMDFQFQGVADRSGRYRTRTRRSAQSSKPPPISNRPDGSGVATSASTPTSDADKARS